MIRQCYRCTPYVVADYSILKLQSSATSRASWCACGAHRLRGHRHWCRHRTWHRIWNRTWNIDTALDSLNVRNILDHGHWNRGWHWNLSLDLLDDFPLHSPFHHLDLFHGNWGWNWNLASLRNRNLPLNLNSHWIWYWHRARHWIWHWHWHWLVNSLDNRNVHNP